jgi:hypothetical protein
MSSRTTLFLAAGLAIAWPAAAETMHPPKTPPERALDAILKQADQDPDLLDNLFDGRDKRPYRAAVDYTKVLTAPLMAAMSAKEKSLVQAGCDGHYRKGESCGLDYSPITCAQDLNDLYLYRTNASSADRAEITYAWPGTKKSAATYRLVHQGNAWKIDGISCTGGDAFNFGKS